MVELDKNELLRVLRAPTIERVTAILSQNEIPRSLICDRDIQAYSVLGDWSNLEGTQLEHELRERLELYSRYTEIRDHVIVPKSRERIESMDTLLKSNGFHPSGWFLFGSVAAAKFNLYSSDVDIGLVLPENEVEDDRALELLGEVGYPGKIMVREIEMEIELTRYSTEWLTRRKIEEASDSISWKLASSFLRDGGARIVLKDDTLEKAK